MSLLEATGIHVSYGSVNAVRDVSLAVAPGEVVGIIGANGAGKSSFLKALMGLAPVRAGQVVFDGRELARSTSVRGRVRAGLSMSPEGRGILTGLSVQENLELGTFGARGMSSRARAARLDVAYDLFPVLKMRKDQAAQTLSGGEAAMLSVARALMPAPKVVLLDEPTLGLAPTVSARLFEQVRLLKQTGITMLIVEQRVTELLTIVDRVLQLKSGEAKAPRAPEEFEADELDALYFGSH